MNNKFALLKEYSLKLLDGMKRSFKCLLKGIIDAETSTVKPGTTKIRQGMTKEPLMTDFLQPIACLPVLHAKINSLKFWENLGYSFNARNSFANKIPIRGAGKRKSDEQGAAVKQEKYNFRESAKQKLNLPLDMPDPSGAGGNTGTFLILIL